PVAPRPDAPPMPPRPDLMKSGGDPEPGRGDAPTDVPRLVLGAGAHVALGPAPGAALGVVASAEVANLRWSLAVEGRYDLPASARASHGATARTSLLGVQLAPCLRAQGMWACAVVLLANVHAAAARDLEGRTRGDLFLLGVGVRLAVHLSLPLDFALRVGIEVLGHPLPIELTQGGARLFKSSAVTATLGPTIVRVF
ncbi:MAG TPA: hypothetical protein VLT33_43460, partial [Labilithrix sp.]|nr:hypothetical protein [Labilithrix sp.]